MSIGWAKNIFIWSSVNLPKKKKAIDELEVVPRVKNHSTFRGHICAQRMGTSAATSVSVALIGYTSIDSLVDRGIGGEWKCVIDRKKKSVHTRISEKTNFCTHSTVDQKSNFTREFLPKFEFSNFWLFEPPKIKRRLSFH